MTKPLMNCVTSSQIIDNKNNLILDFNDITLIV